MTIKTNQWLRNHFLERDGADSSKIDMVKATARPRCVYCGKLGERGNVKCAGCGASF